MLHAPPAFTLVEPARFNDVAAAPREIVSVVPAASGMPPSLVLPARLHVCFFLLEVALMPSVIGSGTNARDSNVPARFGVPLPGVYGVVNISQTLRPADVEAVTSLFSVSFASSSCAPSKERPGVPTGTSHGGRQIFRLYAPKAVAPPVVLLT